MAVVIVTVVGGLIFLGLAAAAMRTPPSSNKKGRGKTADGFDWVNHNTLLHSLDNNRDHDCSHVLHDHDHRSHDYDCGSHDHDHGSHDFDCGSHDNDSFDYDFSDD